MDSGSMLPLQLGIWICCSIVCYVLRSMLFSKIEKGMLCWRTVTMKTNRSKAHKADNSTYNLLNMENKHFKTELSNANLDSYVDPKISTQKLEWPVTQCHWQIDEVFACSVFKLSSFNSVQSSFCITSSSTAGAKKKVFLNPT